MSVPKPERRRRRLLDEGEDAGAETPAVVARSSECESEDEGPVVENSECESAVDDSADQEDETEEGSETETEEGSETEESGSETEGYTDEEGLNEERQSGDGEEQPENDKPDDDEDKKNPAYVPRKGAFYEHDYRRGDEVPEAEVTEELKPKKKLWQDEGKWSHDRYIDVLQAPKSREELIEIYGYDIRIADRPPEAPPRSLRRPKGPRQPNFKDFIPRMAVIDTTEGGHDSVPNLGDDDFIQYSHPGSRTPHRNRGPGTDSRRGGRAAVVGGITRSWRKEAANDNSQDNGKIDSEGTPKLYHGETDGVGYRNSNQERFQQSQDIRRMDDSRGKSRPQYGFREDRRDNFSHPRRRDGNFNSQGQVENWRSVQNDYKDAPSRANDFVRNNRGGYNEFGNNRKRPQLPITGGNIGQGVGNSGDSGYYGNNTFSGKGFEQTPYHQQQAEAPGTASKEAKEYTNSSYKNPEINSKAKGVASFPAASVTDSNAGDNSVSANSSNSLVISNKENVQTINVTITSTTTEKKSYAKERRAKGISRPVDGAVLVAAGAEPQAVPVAPVSSSHYQNLSPAGVRHMDLTSPPLSAEANHYSPMRQQGMFAEPPPVNGAKLYNPALPPPSFYQREHSGLPPTQHPTHTPAGAVPDPAHFTPTLLPPATALPYGLPASSAGLALQPTAAGIPPNPALFQASSGPPAASSIAPPAAVIAAPFLPTGMIYAGGTRVPPPGAPAGFPLTLAYTTPPPQGTVPAAVVGSQPPPQAAAPGQHTKIYRGDITYYAPELQQPARTTQKRPKAAIPIINPQNAPAAYPLGKTDVATPQAKLTPPVNHTDSMKASSSLDGSEVKKLAIKTELSPGGPPVNSSASGSASLSKVGDQSLSTAMQGFKIEDNSGRVEMSACALGSSVVKQECEKSVAGIGESSIA
ncbi:unnamed protein product [Candidula unifasciata]|uniref:Protein CASC3 n=1 Tax=Candidula unifasciata TaxID=100452 RepID=A0A8S3ZRE1_9EUPU|nr:unnamed protein product [Candidula unifasciata]